MMGQPNNPSGQFYLPKGVNQFEVNKGKFYWLSKTSLQILKEDTGELIKSVPVSADNFAIDSEDNVILINTATKEINRFTADGTHLDQIPIENYTPGLRLSLTKDGEPLFYSDTTLFLNN